MTDRIRSIRFNSNITDEQVKIFFGEENVIEIRRGSWQSNLEVYSDEPGEELLKRLDERFADWQRRKNELLEQKHNDRYEQNVKELYDGVLGMPISAWNNKTKKKEYGYRYLDDDYKWVSVWCDDGFVPKTYPRHDIYELPQ